MVYEVANDWFECMTCHEIVAAVRGPSERMLKIQQGKKAVKDYVKLANDLRAEREANETWRDRPPML